MDRGRDGDAHSLDLVEEILVVQKGTRRKTFSDFVNPCLVNVGHADQIDLGTSCVFLRMERTKISDADDTNLKLLHLSADPPFRTPDEINHVGDLRYSVNLIIQNSFHRLA